MLDAVSVDEQQACAVGVVFADPQATLVTEQEGGVEQPIDHHRVLAIVRQGANLAIGFFGVQQAPIVAASEAFGFGQAGTQHIKLAAGPVITHKAAIALAVFDGIQVVAVIPQALHAFTVEQVGNLAIAGQAHRRLTAFLAEHPSALCRDHAIGLGKIVDHHDTVAGRGDLEDAAAAIIQLAADQQAAIRLRQKRCGLGHITMQHLDIPAGGGLDRVEALPCKETQGGGEHAGSGGQGDAGAALAQELRHVGLLGNAGDASKRM
ncbi:hypothetical protein D3C81_1435150 [compost metagenome]